MNSYARATQFYLSSKTEKLILCQTMLGRNLYAVKVGFGRPIGIAQYAIHGREFITERLAELHAEIGVERGSLWILPLTNPDGALLSEVGLASVPEPVVQNELLRLNQNSTDFFLWKANARGVDLNVNFAAGWGRGKNNVFTAGCQNYVGERPFSETETQALRVFTLAIRPDYTVSYHTKGEEIYWYFHQSLRHCARDKALAQVLSDATGYALGEARGSAGGYKDWCIQKLRIPSFTIETGADRLTHPLKNEDDILQKNAFALRALSAAVAELL